jgi:hypothetical protein
MPEKLKTEQMPEEPEKQYPVRRVCAWCQKDLGLADYTSKEAGLVTHAICEECLEKEFKKHAQRHKSGK